MIANKAFYRHRVLLAGLCIFFCTIQSCIEPSATSPNKHTNRAFYYWKSEFLLTPSQTNALKQADIKKLYVKMFDVDWSEQYQRAVPVAPVKFTDTPPDFANIVPVVYITNKVFVNLPDTLAPTLADSICRKVFTLLPDVLCAPVSEIQFDCDWTATTKNRFFAFLQAAKNLPYMPSVISVTLRLHQLKHQTQTGIPPANRAMLMFYNMGNFKDPHTHNSILDLNTATPYLKYLKNYPLPTDVALPMFSWGVVFRNGKFTNLINNLTTQQAKINPQILQPIGKNYYKARQTTQLNGSSIGINDVVRIEEITAKQAKQAAQYLQPLLPTPSDTLNIALFHLHPQFFSRFTTTQIGKIFNALQ
ncbi:MAG TPA: hypothetical protein PK239_04080 [Chitinophagales bacterium]|nr:hypothetical protein [Chitinophagales bacterium]HRK26449.1 hypothetical protein [Chitinophagales bacterium]